MGTSDVCREGKHHLCQNVTLYGWPSCQCPCHAEPRLIGTGLTSRETDLLDTYLLSFITIKQYLERAANSHTALGEYKRMVEQFRKDLSPPTREPEGSGG